MTAQVWGAKCTTCGATSYPRHGVCPQCRGERFEPAPIAGDGRVLSYTDVYALAIDYETRYLRLAIVELDDGTRAIGHLIDPAPSLGKRVSATIGVVREPGEERIYGLRFVPV